jgi:hypothetical protein
MQNRLHFRKIWRLSTCIKNTVPYIYIEGDLCFGDSELNTIVKDIVAYIYVEGASCLGERELNII